MGLHDDVHPRPLFGLNEAAETPASDPLSDARREEREEQTDGFQRALIVAWLVAALLVAVVLLIEPAGHAVGLAGTDRPRVSGEVRECSDLDYAYQRC